jgi:hypothetical protein
MKTPKRGVGRPPRRADAGTHRKTSEQIEYKQASNWIRAVDFARSVLGQPMTVHVTVQWRLAPSATPEPERVSDLLNDLAIWIRRRTHQRAVWAYSREGGLKKGVHLHLLVHVPPHLIEDFTVAVKRWIEAKADSFEGRAVRVDPIHLPTLDNLKSYLLKEGDNRVHEACGVLAHHRADRKGYPVPGKRMGVSHSINATARSRHAMPLNDVLATQDRL